MINSQINKVNILFDEQGTPTLSANRETNYFIGVSVSYKIEIENELFTNYNNLFGLSKSKPLKNDKISFSRALEIAKFLSNFDLQINIYYLDLCNKELHSTVKLYEEFSNIFRTKFRNVRPRPIPQILYSQILEHTLFMSVCDYMKINQITSKFSIYVDNWSIPDCDVNIALNTAGHSLEQKNNDINQKFFPGAFTICDDIKLLDKDSDRKRFIDVVASILSRNYLNKSHPKYCADIFNIVFQNKYFNSATTNATTATVDTLKLIMDDVSGNG
jgi:hypothetical protein